MTMAETAEQVDNVLTPWVATPRRFGDADFSDMGQWLLDRLAQSSFTYLTEQNYVGWLRQCMMSSECLFLRTQNAVGMAWVSHHAITRQIDIEEVFVLLRDPDSKQQQAEGRAIYVEFKKWGALQGARECRVNYFTDVSRETVKSVFGRLVIRERSIGYIVEPEPRAGIKVA
jgi:hypothetical protein